MSNVGQLFEEVGNDYFSKYHGPISEIYLDFEYLQDLKFGAILYGISVPKELEYVQSKLSVYNQRMDFETAKYFPIFNKTEKDLKALLTNIAPMNWIALKAPFTTFYDLLLEGFQIITTHNKSASTKPIIIHLTINVEYELYPKELLQFLQYRIQHLFPNIRVEFIYNTRYTLDISEYLKQDLLFLYDIESFVKENTATSRQFVQEGGFFNKRIYARPYINPSFRYKEEDYETILKSTQANLNIYCDFQYIPSLIPIFK